MECFDERERFRARELLRVLGRTVLETLQTEGVTTDMLGACDAETPSTKT